MSANVGISVIIDYSSIVFLRFNFVEFILGPGTCSILENIR